MTRKQYTLMILLALVTGLIGGVLSSQLFTIQTVFAEKKGKPLKVIEANEFRLVDIDGKILAALKLEEALNDPPKPYFKLQDRYAGLWLYSRNGKSLIELSTNPWRSDNGFHMPIGTHLSLCNPSSWGGIELLTDPTNVGIEIELNKNTNTKISPEAIEIYGPGGYRSHVSSQVLCAWDSDGKTGVSMANLLSGPRISLVQNGNIRSTLGCMDLVTKKTGTKITRSGASLVLFDEKQNVIWSTPQ